MMHFLHLDEGHVDVEFWQLSEYSLPHHQIQMAMLYNLHAFPFLWPVQA
jgi:hypothetical protein